MPALPPYIIEPVWEQFRALLPQREVDHPLGCHRRRISDRVIFEKLVQVLVFGCSYRRIADEECSATTLRERRDEWIELGAMEELREKALVAYDRLIGLDLLNVAVDGCITKAPCGGEKAGRSPVDRGKQGIKRSIAVDALGIPLGAIIAPANRHDSPLLAPTLDAVVETLGGLPEETSVHLDRGYDSELTCERLADRGLLAEISIEGQAGAVLGHESVGGREDEFVAQRPQEACVVHGTRSTGGRLLGGVLGGGHHREETDPGSVEPLPLGDTAASQTMTYPRKLLTMRVLR